MLVATREIKANEEKKSEVIDNSKHIVYGIVWDMIFTFVRIYTGLHKARYSLGVIGVNGVNALMALTR